MPIQSHLTPDDQAQSLCAFLAQGKHQLSFDTARRITQSLEGTDKAAAQALREQLAVNGVQIKHMHAIKAINVIRGVQAYRPTGQQVIWEVASWFDDAPSATPFRQTCKSLADAADTFIRKLSSDLAEEDSEFLYARLCADEAAVELVFIGDPLGHQRWLLACTDDQGSPQPFPVGQQAKFAERVRRTVEGRHDGWTDGVFGLHARQLRTPQYHLIDGGSSRTVRFESQIAQLLEPRAGSAPASGDVPIVTLQDAALTSGERSKLLARCGAWSKRYTAPLWELVDQRVTEHGQERFARSKINATVLADALASKTDKLAALQEQLEISTADLNGWVRDQEMPVSKVADLARALGVAASAIYSEANFRPLRMPIDAEMVAMTLARFPHIEVETDPQYGTPKHLEQALESLSSGDFAGRRREYGAGPTPALIALSESLRAAGAQFCFRINPQFVQDLPLGRERMAQIATLSIVDRAIIDMVPIQATESDDDLDPDWSGTDDKVLARLNAVQIHTRDLFSVTKEYQSMIAAGNERDWETTMFATARVFRGKPDHAHAAHVRLESMGKLMDSGALPGWSLQSSEGPDVVMASRPIFEAAASCPLTRVGKRIGFEVNTFRLHLLQHADTNHETLEH